MEDYATLQRIPQLGNGDWSLNQTWYEWLSINGPATNYGVNIQCTQRVVKLQEESGPIVVLVGNPSTQTSHSSQG